MSGSEIHHMDIISDSGSVMGVVIVSEDVQTISFSDGNLGYIRQQVIWNSLWILADKPAFMGADGVKVPQENDVPFRIGGMEVCQHLFNHPFGPSIRIGRRALRAFLGDWNKCRISVDGGRGAEYNIFYLMIFHTVHQIKCSSQAVVVVLYGFLHRFANCLQPGKMNHGIWLFPSKDRVQGSFV